MFDKIALVDNVIKIAKFIISYEEIFDENSEPIKHEEWALSETERDRTIARLEQGNIPYIVTPVEIPSNIKQYDGMAWTNGRDAALLMINGDPSYRIAELKTLLNQYDKKVIQHDRCHRMGIECKHDIAELDRQAEEWVAEINRLEGEMQNV